ncbi:MAG: hypothetical protein IJO06_00730, partial [Thermoguttaceae bacterium]|nr:hypothetical protein [Thermoguttaceae bacterium]
ELDKTLAELAVKQEAKTAFDAGVAELDARLAAIQESSDALAAERQEKMKRTTNLKIELAKTEERVGFLNDLLKRLDDARLERGRRTAENERRVESLRERIRVAELTILNGTATLAGLYSAKETLVAAQKTASAERRRLEKIRDEATAVLQTNRDALEKRREEIRSKEIAAERLAQEIKTLEERIREDYGLDLADAKFRVEEENERRSSKIAGKNSANAADASDDAQNNGVDDEREIVVPRDASGARRRQKEIEELRKKLRDLGPVNLEAIETLETLKTRYATLFNQYNDLVSARKSIQKIIERVNGDCRRLFEETFEAVKIYFCNIFQKLFGGGRADLTLEDPSNPLESGVDVVARPPGKELKSLTLMSGGEKSLTCVALLLAIFQYRTSPICVLDEVDAALDEGNVNRFANALRDFIPTTQFLLVTHSKKTMSSAKSIYGVTMEDSGVSKILSVRFDDVGEDGEILIKEKTPVAQAPKIAPGTAAG